MQSNLKKVCGATMQQSGYHHANLLASQICEDIKQQIHQRDSEVLASLQDIPITPFSNQNATPLQHPTANTLTTSQAQLEILKLIKELSADVKSNRTSNAN